MPNRLAQEISPYLLQHAHNPVDWFPWGEEALEKARAEDKPIFLSIGYAACHWCHVMERESFTDPEIAELLNQNFVSIKVDREERPDLDHIYMNAVVAMTGQGGWPMSVFLAPDGRPFFGGTYFPPRRRYNMPSFREILTAIHKAWKNDRGEMLKSGDSVTAHIRQETEWVAAQQPDLRPATFQAAIDHLISHYDWQNGGWGQAPRFPQPLAIETLLLAHLRGQAAALEPAVHVLEWMQRGGLYDVVGGGFHRYSTDDQWLVPHFEKMLYDNAQLAQVYLHAYLITRRPDFLHTCAGALDFMLSEMRHPSGGFFASLDADSPGGEGAYYTWSADELQAVFDSPEDYAAFTNVYTVTRHGNFEGKNILQRAAGWEDLAQAAGLSVETLLNQASDWAKRLRAARQRRDRPATDDKILAGWNGLALRALAEAARYLNRADYLEAARQTGNFILTRLYREEQLYRSWRENETRQPAFLEDYAAVILGLLALYQSDPDPRWYRAAADLLKQMLALFSDDNGGFLDTRAGQMGLLMRPKNMQDSATPAGNALAARALLEFSAFSGDDTLREKAENLYTAMQSLMAAYPTAFGSWLQGFDLALGPIQQVALIGELSSPETAALIQTVWSAYRPRQVFAAAPAADPRIELLAERHAIAGKPSVYVCRQMVCLQPVFTPAEIQAALD